MKFDTMVICSTLNQMVNYIAIKKHGIEKVINITGETNENHANLKKFNYGEWNKNLKDVLDDIIFEDPDICFGNKEARNYSEMIDKLGKLFNSKDKPILWNITGGQRYIVMAITEYVFKNRKDDVIVYFEGDTEKFLYYGNTKEDISTEIKNDYKCEMNIPLAFKLMGMSVKEREEYKVSDYYNLFFKGKDESEITDEDKRYIDEYKFYNEFYEKYCDDIEILKILVEVNKDKPDGEIVEDKLDWVINKLRDKCKEFFNDKNENIFKESIEKEYRKRKVKRKVFGYILEKMSFYRMIKILTESDIKDVIADIDMGVKINFSDKKRRISEHHIDEFDIVVVTNMGKVVIFECKSGYMCGDNAKSTHYSTYKVSGVYGAPVLIDPIIEKQNIKEESFENIRKAENAASKAGLIICRMGNKDNTGDSKNGIYSLEDYLKSVFESEGE
ncbi:hypothetical protein SAMN02745883_00333 [Caminicella sporogenes DSM 14501]|uniref:DUF1887 family protein n=1 Tax=Caminicella sporogenes DSM 14501 TaxID=1121266 RepID=A0A1M6LSY4_9FIRM|nr:hypothetical protein [Caminicella sporogenes]RKD27939.1 hypothetical protein BET04_02450 [Caminicella sporogenes]SHJ74275.1 hypothetical protein SAMN02745883_00333 [Caminicella sporogenes DSM 14501]